MQASSLGLGPGFCRPSAAAFARRCVLNGRRAGTCTVAPAHTVPLGSCLHGHLGHRPVHLAEPTEWHAGKRRYFYTARACRIAWLACMSGNLAHQCLQFRLLSSLVRLGGASWDQVQPLAARPPQLLSHPSCFAGLPGQSYAAGLPNSSFGSDREVY